MGALPQILRRVAGYEPPFSLLPAPDVLASSAAELLFRGVAARPKPKRAVRSVARKR
jgi:hypothetical protein